MSVTKQPDTPHCEPISHWLFSTLGINLWSPHTTGLEFKCWIYIRLAQISLQVYWTGYVWICKPPCTGKIIFADHLVLYKSNWSWGFIKVSFSLTLPFNLGGFPFTMSFYRKHFHFSQNILYIGGQQLHQHPQNVPGWLVCSQSPWSQVPVVLDGESYPGQL